MASLQTAVERDVDVSDSVSDSSVSDSVSDSDDDNFSTIANHSDDGDGDRETRIREPASAPAPASASASAPASAPAAAADDDDEEDRRIPQTNNLALFTCVACLEADNTSGYRCATCTSALCSECMSEFIGHRMEARTVSPIICFGEGCSEAILFENLQTVLPKQQVRALKRLITLMSDKNWAECPKCDALTLKTRSGADMTCSACAQPFCFYHGLAHEGQPCKPKHVSVRAKVGAAMWKFVHTKKCPGCQRLIQKNGGCNHMTCLCGYEICWSCGGKYEKNGHRGHSRSLFPGRSEFRYCCNNTTQWMQRFGVIVLGVPVAATALGVAIPTVPMYLGYQKFTRWWRSRNMVSFFHGAPAGIDFGEEFRHELTRRTRMPPSAAAAAAGAAAGAETETVPTPAVPTPTVPTPTPTAPPYLGLWFGAEGIEDHPRTRNAIRRMRRRNNGSSSSPMDFMIISPDEHDVDSDPIGVVIPGITGGDVDNSAVIRTHFTVI